MNTLKLKNLPKKIGHYDKVHLISHTDLDGVGPSIVLQAYGIMHEADFVETRKVDEAVLARLEELQDNELLIITDLSVSEEVAEAITKVNKEPNARFVCLIDHHASALYLNDYSWASEIPLLDDIKMSATTLIFKYLDEAGYVINPQYQEEDAEVIDYSPQQIAVFFDRLARFVENVRLYDTWDWHALKIQEAADLNTIFYARRRHEFIKDRFNYILTGQLFTEADDTYLTFSKDELRKVLKKKEKQLVIVKDYSLEGHDTPLNIGVVETDSYISELGNHLAEKFAEEIDCVFIVSLVKNRVSLRSIGKAVNLSEVAKHYNGGGHPNASGCDLSALGMDFIVAIQNAPKAIKK